MVTAERDGTERDGKTVVRLVPSSRPVDELSIRYRKNGVNMKTTHTGMDIEWKLIRIYNITYLRLFCFAFVCFSEKAVSYGKILFVAGRFVFFSPLFVVLTGIAGKSVVRFSK